MLVWLNVIFVWRTYVRPVSFVTFDFALTVVLGIAAVLLVTGVQMWVDAYEIVVAVVVTFLLIELGMLAELLPPVLKAVPVVLAIVGPGVAVIWKQSAALGEPSTQRRAMLKLAVTSLVYCQLAILVGIGQGDMFDVFDTISSEVLGYISIPLVLLLVAAHHPRQKASSGRRAASGIATSSFETSTGSGTVSGRT